MNTDNKPELYRQREARIEAALRFEDVDRVPFLFSGPGYAPRSQGLSMKEFCWNPDAALQASLDTLDDLNAVAEVDGIQAMQVGCFPCLLTNQWWSKVDWPGTDLPDDSLWQVHEAETMSADDYDDIIENGWEAYLEVILPKVQNEEGLAVHDKWMAENIPTVADRYRERGYVPFTGGVTEVPYEALCGARKMQNFFRDMRKVPDKVDAAIRAGMNYWVGAGIGAATATGVKSLWLGGWRTAPGLLAPKLWDRFVWPYFEEIVHALHAEGIRAVLHLDANWDREIPRLKELPKGACVLSTDGSTDLRRAREILGDHMPVLGDVPPGVLSVGTPDEVRTYVRDLIKDLGREGLIMNTGCDMPFTTPKANAEALVLATHEFGTK